MGLTITRQIIELMKGHISLESTPGQGSCFLVQLPVTATFSTSVKKQDEPAPANNITGYDRKDGDSDEICILVVDDIEDNRVVLREMLGPLNFEIQEADSGESCLRYLSRRPVDLVLMDLRMPGLNGIETTKKLHCLPGLENLAVIAVSASAYQEDLENSRAAGCIDYLSKPIERNLLLESLQKYLPLDWKYAQTQEQSSIQNESLSEEQCGILLDMLNHGAIARVMQYLDELEQSPDCPPQVRELSTLAKNFELGEIRLRLGASQTKSAISREN